MKYRLQNECNQESSKKWDKKNVKQDGLRITEVREKERKEKNSLQYKRKNLLLQFYPIGQN